MVMGRIDFSFKFIWVAVSRSLVTDAVNQIPGYDGDKCFEDLGLISNNINYKN